MAALSIETTFATHYANLGMDENVDGDFVSHMVQVTVVDANCRFDQPACVADAQGAFAQWMAVPFPDDLTSNPINKHAR